MMHEYPLNRHGRLRMFSVLVVTPIERISELPIYGKLVGAVIALASLLFSDLLAGIFTLLVASNSIDYYLGRHVAKRKKVYDPVLAQAGALSKISAILMVMLLRGFEFWATSNHVPGVGLTRGTISAAIATGLFILDLESIEHHRTFIGAKPIPGFSHVVAWLRAIEARLLPTLPPLPVEHRRAEDQPGEAFEHLRESDA